MIHHIHQLPWFYHLLETYHSILAGPCQIRNPVGSCHPNIQYGILLGNLIFYYPTTMVYTRAYHQHHLRCNAYVQTNLELHHPMQRRLNHANNVRQRLNYLPNHLDVWMILNLIINVQFHKYLHLTRLLLH